MDQQEGLATNKPPLFTRDNYEYQSVRMKCHLMSLGYKVWRSVEKEYKILDDLRIDKYELDQYESNAKSMSAILSGLKNSVFVKFMQCKTVKHVQEKLKIIYEGVSKFKQSKIQTYKGQFESLKMKEEENIAECILRVDEIFHAIRVLGGVIKEREVAEKVLRILPMKQ